MLEKIQPPSPPPPKLFGLRFDQLIVLLGCMIAGCQFYAVMSAIPFAGHDLRMYIAIALLLLGPVYCWFTRKSSPFQRSKND
jgi:hypothetical protein